MRFIVLKERLGGNFEEGSTFEVDPSNISLERYQKRYYKGKPVLHLLCVSANLDSEYINFKDMDSERLLKVQRAVFDELISRVR
ncbi:MAG: hypothetical protein ABSA75_13515 [Candidatus Bathyarchaeia archaeon]|jgi:hypothetical protein